MRPLATERLERAEVPGTSTRPLALASRRTTFAARGAGGRDDGSVRVGKPGLLGRQGRPSTSRPGMSTAFVADPAEADHDRRRRPGGARRRARQVAAPSAMPLRHGHAGLGAARRRRDRRRLLAARDRDRDRPRSADRPRRPFRRGRPVRDARRAAGDVRHRLHRRRRALLAARHPALGAGGRPDAAAGRHVLHPRGASGAVVAGGRARRPRSWYRPAIFRGRRSRRDGMPSRSGTRRRPRSPPTTSGAMASARSSAR